MARRDFHRVVIGRAELLDLIDVEMMELPAKIDTGAYRSAVHADKIRLSEDGKMLTFRLLGGHPVCGAAVKEITTSQFNEVRIANSFGHEEDRYEVRLKVKIGPKVFLANFTLANRSKKIYPILLGRKLLNNRFIVDTAETSVNRVELKAKYGIDFPRDEEDSEE